MAPAARQGRRALKPVALEASGLLSERPTGVGIYGRGLVRGLLEATGGGRTGAGSGNRGGRTPERLQLICPASRWHRRGSVRDLGLALRPYVSGRFLPRWSSLVHLLDTRWPRGYQGPLIATVFDTISALPLSRELGLASESFRRKKLAAYSEIARRADVVITLASAVRDEIVTRFPAVRRVEVIPPGLDLPDASRLRARSRGALREYGIEPPFLLAVGALCPRKNLQTVVAVFDAARRRWPDLQLVLAGSPDYGWEGSEGERAVKDCQGKVRLTGYLPREALWAAIMNARCVLQLSFYEGYGLTVLEALAVGTPVIASRCGGIPEAGGGSAWLVEPRDRDGAIGTLERVLTGGREVTEQQRRGCVYARDFTWDRAARAVLKLYEEVIGGAGLPVFLAPG